MTQPGIFSSVSQSTPSGISNLLLAPVDNTLLSADQPAPIGYPEKGGSQPPDLSPSLKTQVEDDDVQFVFSVPRRKKKKRRRSKALYLIRVYANHVSRHEFSHPGLDESWNQSEPIDALVITTNNGSENPFAAVLETPRRGTTGMVQQLESLRIGVDKPTIAKTGSLPSLCLSNVSLTPQTTLVNLSDASTTLIPTQMEVQDEPFTDFPTTMDWWTDQVPTIQSTNPLQYGWNFYPLNSSELKKRKRSDEDDASTNLESSMIDLRTELGALGEKSRANLTYDRKKEGPYFSGSQQGLTNPNSTRCNFTTPANLTIQSPTSCRSSEMAVSARPNQSSISPPEPQRTVAFPQFEPRRQEAQKYHSVQVPVSMVPDQSVSPRTKTVQITRPVLTSMYQSPYPIVTTPGQNTGIESSSSSVILPIPQNSAQSSPSFQTVVANSTTWSPPILSSSAGTAKNYSLSSPIDATGFSYSTPVKISPIPTQSDLLRKPSLYKVPAWTPPLSQSPPAPNSPISNRSGRPNADPIQQMTINLTPKSTTMRSPSQSASQDLSNLTQHNISEQTLMSSSPQSQPQKPIRKHPPNL
jgi:hypothetical protein